MTLGSILVFAGCFVAAEIKIHQQQKELDTLYKDNTQVGFLERKIDSLNSETFSKDIQIHRYEYILDEINSSTDISPKSKTVIENIMANTE